MLRALDSASCDILHETGGAICCRHWDLDLVISHTGRGYDLLPALDSASRDITNETGVRFFTGIGFCVVRYHIRDKECTIC